MGDDLQRQIDEAAADARRLGGLLQDKLDHLRSLQEQQAAEGGTPEDRRRGFRLIGGGLVVAGAGVVTAAKHVRDHPAPAAALIAAMAAGMLVFTGPPTSDPEIGSDPPRAVGTLPNPGVVIPTGGPPQLQVPSGAPTTVGPSPLPSGDGAATPGPTASPPEPSVPPTPTTEPSPTASPKPTETPSPPEPTPTPTEPEPTPTPEPPESPTPSPTQTPTGSPSPPSQREPTLCLDINDLLDLEACVDVPLLDGLLNRQRILYG